jgi:hypothetical protein
MTQAQAINLLDELTYGEIREQLKLLSETLLDLVGIDCLSELDDQQIYSLAIDCLTDY